MHNINLNSIILCISSLKLNICLSKQPNEMHKHTSIHCFDHQVHDYIETAINKKKRRMYSESNRIGIKINENVRE